MMIAYIAGVRVNPERLSKVSPEAWAPACPGCGRCQPSAAGVMMPGLVECISCGKTYACTHTLVRVMAWPGGGSVELCMSCGLSRRDAGKWEKVRDLEGERHKAENTEINENTGDMT